MYIANNSQVYNPLKANKTDRAVTITYTTLSGTPQSCM